MAGQARIGGKEFDGGEILHFPAAAMRRVLPVHAMARPGAFGLGIAREAEARGPVLAAGGVEDEAGEGAAFHRGGRDQIGRQSAAARPVAGEHRVERGAGAGDAGPERLSHRGERARARLQHEHLAERKRGHRQGIDGERGRSFRGLFLEQVVVAHQHLEGQAGAESLQHQPGSVGNGGAGEQHEIVGEIACRRLHARAGAGGGEQGVVAGLVVVAGRLQPGHGDGARQLVGLGTAGMPGLERVLLVMQAQQAFGGIDQIAHDASPFRRSSNTRRMVSGLIGWPFTSVQQSTSTSVRARSSMASWL